VNTGVNSCRRNENGKKKEVYNFKRVSKILSINTFPIIRRKLATMLTAATLRIFLSRRKNALRQALQNE
jgi:hypothetical protein